MTQRRPLPLRVLVAANLLVSALLSSDSTRSAAAAIFAAAREEEFSLIVPFQALEEVERVTSEKPWLSVRVTPEEVATFVEVILTVAEVLPRITEPIPCFTRDPGDDYLIAHAVLARANFLVTRDKDLLDLQNVEEVGIIGPAEFMELLRHHRT